LYSIRDCALDPAKGTFDFHYPALEPLARYGWLGVDLFFIISGFVITLSAEGRSAAAFVRARAKRLYPAFWAACTLTAAVLLESGNPPPGVDLGRFATNLTLFAPFFGQDSIDGVYWTLYIEIRFYLLIALILAVGLTSRIVELMTVWLAFSLLNLFLPIPHGSGGLLLAYAPLFVSGVLACRLAQGTFRPWHVPVLAAAVALSVIYTIRRADPALSALVIACAILLFHAAIFAIAGARGALPSVGFLPLLGYLSYPIYLLHNEIGTCLLPDATEALGKYPALVVVVAAMVALAAGVHYFVERPLNSMGRGISLLGRRPRPSKAAA
jgi:peptidoglycan/LPS O-acetylase OafA/YrhL